MWMKVKAFLGRFLILYAIVACVIIGVAAWLMGVVRSGAALLGVLLLQTVILEIGIAADLKRRARRNLRLIMIPVSVELRFGSVWGRYSENVSRRLVPLHKLLLWVLPALYLVCFISCIIN